MFIDHYVKSCYGVESSFRSVTMDEASKDDIFMSCKNTLQYGLRSVRYAGAKILEQYL